MFKIIPITGIITAVVEEHCDPKDEYQSYTECLMTTRNGQEIRVHIPDISLDLSKTDGLSGKGYYATGVCEKDGLCEKMQMFFMTEWYPFDSIDDWHKKTAA